MTKYNLQGSRDKNGGMRKIFLGATFRVPGYTGNIEPFLNSFTVLGDRVENNRTVRNVGVYMTADGVDMRILVEGDIVSIDVSSCKLDSAEYMLDRFATAMSAEQIREAA
ncbi:MAG TPA: hypothetical protein VJH04_02310 [archaeon]|nr:hypothetical protein [archaeon]